MKPPVPKGAVSLTLPWPPSVNRYYRSVRGKVLVSQVGRQYRAHVQQIALVRNFPRFGRARLQLCIWAYRCDKRRYDLDNLLKALQDALEAAAVYRSDGQIDELHVWRMPPAPPGRLEISLMELAEDE